MLNCFVRRSNRHGAVGGKTSGATRPFLLLVGAVCALAASAILAFLAAERQSPDLAIEPPVAEVGVVQQNQRVQHTFRVQNLTADRVKVVEVMKHCDCAQADVSPQTIEPGGTAQLSVDWQIGARDGPVETEISLLTAGSGRSAGLRVTSALLRAVVKSDYTFAPAELTFRRGIAQTQRIRLLPHLAPAAEIRIVEALSDHESLKTTISDPTEVSVDFAPNLWPWDRSQATLLLKVQGSEEQRRYVRVRVL